MESINRRGFLKKSAVAAAGLMVSAPMVKKGFAKNSPNETVNIGVTGIRSRGRAHYRSFGKIPNVNVAAICDIDENLFPKAVEDIEKMTGKKPKTYVDFRDMIQDKDIDAVSIATPDHWHALQTIWACQAGKDVFVEKPSSHNIYESRKMVEAARKYNRVVQVGTQARSSPVHKEAIKLLNDGYIGKVYMGRALIFKSRSSIGRKKDSLIPKGVNWDIFLGPAPYRPFNENRFHYTWHWYWDTGTAEIGNQVHQIDIARWGMDKRVHPVKIHSAGGFYAWDSDQETPNLQTATFEYEDGMMMENETRQLFTNNEDGIMVGNLFYGSEGWMHLVGEGSGTFTTYFGRKNEPGKSMSRKDIADDPMNLVGAVGGPHFNNFIECVRSGKWQDLNADIKVGHMSVVLCHLANISYLTGRKLKFNPYSEKFVNDDDANTYLSREYRYPYAVPDEV